MSSSFLPSEVSESLKLRRRLRHRSIAGARLLNFDHYDGTQDVGTADGSRIDPRSNSARRGHDTGHRSARVPPSNARHASIPDQRRCDHPAAFGWPGPGGVEVGLAVGRDAGPAGTAGMARSNTRARYCTPQAPERTSDDLVRSGRYNSTPARVSLPNAHPASLLVQRRSDYSSALGDPHRGGLEIELAVRRDADPKMQRARRFRIRVPTAQASSARTNERRPRSIGPYQSHPVRTTPLCLPLSLSPFLAPSHSPLSLYAPALPFLFPIHLRIPYLPSRRDSQAPTEAYSFLTVFPSIPVPPSTAPPDLRFPLLYLRPPNDPYDTPNDSSLTASPPTRDSHTRRRLRPSSTPISPTRVSKSAPYPHTPPIIPALRSTPRNANYPTTYDTSGDAAPVHFHPLRSLQTLEPDRTHPSSPSLQLAHRGSGELRYKWNVHGGSAGMERKGSWRGNWSTRRGKEEKERAGEDGRSRRQRIHEERKTARKRDAVDKGGQGREDDGGARGQAQMMMKRKGDSGEYDVVERGRRGIRRGGREKAWVMAGSGMT
ncbi:hypothetical protein FA13DRAFT_1709661 [Coprinellus micaceus]|uniref:Uncharacterized protein n=1 Tax=Coprinellus micaceus TaxID=71717 RepID=A0A4Y7TC94_COPMI|nr:hypothetical protein FA13DRAFT_1709661 [Coprinellus micaceus]